MAMASTSNTDPLQFDVEKDLPEFLFKVLDRTGECLNADTGQLQAQLVVVHQTVNLLRSITETCDISEEDRFEWQSLSRAFSDILLSVQEHIKSLSVRPSSMCERKCKVTRTGTPGRPPFYITAEALEDLRGIGFSWEKIASLFGVSRWTIYRKVQRYGLSGLNQFSLLSDTQLDEIVTDYLSRHGLTTGRTYLAGYFKSLGLRVQRRRMRESLARVDPANTALRWGIVVFRRQYCVPWPNSLWHLDGHHSLIRWGLVIHGCIDGFSRRIMFLKCNNNSLSQTVLELFLNATEKDGLWPSRIRVDHGVENVLVCEAMVQARGTGRGSFIAGPSTRNQRIERLWRDVFRCVCQFCYYVLFAMEDTGLLNIDNPIDLFALHLTFMPRINVALTEFIESSNHRPVRTANHWSPYQMWVNGMLHEGNPLAHGQLDDMSDDLEIYGVDSGGPSPFEDSDNNVIIPPVTLPVDVQSVQSYVQERIDLLVPSTEMGRHFCNDPTDC